MLLKLLVYVAEAIIASELDCDLQPFGVVNGSVHLSLPYVSNSQVSDSASYSSFPMKKRNRHLWGIVSLTQHE